MNPSKAGIPILRNEHNLGAVRYDNVALKCLSGTKMLLDFKCGIAHALLSSDNQSITDEKL